MKKALGYFIFSFLVFVLGHVTVFAAGSINPSTTSISIEKGKTATFTINASNAAGNVLIQSRDSNIASVNTSSYFFDTSLGSSSVSVTVTANNVGNTTISIILDDVGTFNNEELTGTKIVNITVTEPPKPNPEPVQPSQPVQSNNNTSTSKASSESKKEETKKEETTGVENKEEEKQEVKEEPKLKINKFYVVGYDINFNLDKLDYAIDINKDVKAIYIVVEGTDLEVEGDKEINIVGKNRVVIRVKSGSTIEEYTIKLNRIDKEEKEKKNDLNPIFIGTTALFALSTIGLGTYIIIKKKRTA